MFLFNLGYLLVPWGVFCHNTLLAMTCIDLFVTLALGMVKSHVTLWSIAGIILFLRFPENRVRIPYLLTVKCGPFWPFRTRVDMDFLFQGWRVPGGFVLAKTKFLEWDFGPKLIVVQQNFEQKAIWPLCCFIQIHWRAWAPPSSAIIRPAKIAPAVSCGDPRKIPQTKTKNQPVIFRLYLSWNQPGLRKSIKKVLCTTGWLSPSHSPLQFVTKCSYPPED